MATTEAARDPSVGLRSVTMRLDVLPRGDPRKRTALACGHGRETFVHYDEERAAEFKATVRDHAFVAMRTAHLSPLDGPVSIYVFELWPLPKSRWRVRSPVARRRRVSRPDFDNTTKMILDACNGLVFKDDAQVFSRGHDKWDGAQGEQGYLEVRFAEESWT